MDAGDRLADAGLQERVAQGRGVPAARLTVTLTSEALGALGAYLRSGGARGMAFERALLEALGMLPAAQPQPAGRRCTLSARTLRQVRAFIEGNLERDIGVPDIARAAFLSPHRLGRGYRQATGQSLWQYVLQRRACRARSLIDTRPACTLAEIAALCGFESYGQFIAAFRKTHGVTPGVYRRQREGAQ